MKTALAAVALLLLTACGASESDEPADSAAEPLPSSSAPTPSEPAFTPPTAPKVMTVEAIAEDAGCENPRQTDNFMELPEVACTINGVEVNITDSTGHEEAMDYMVGEVLDLGFHVLAVTDTITAGAEDRAALEVIRAEVGGDWLD